MSNFNLLSRANDLDFRREGDISLYEHATIYQENTKLNQHLDHFYFQVTITSYIYYYFKFLK